MRRRALLATAGCALMLTQYVAVREIGSTFFSTELVALGAVVVTLLGPSLAYAISHRISARALAVWGALSVAAHLALPVGLRAGVGVLVGRGLEGWAIAITVIGGALLLTGFYAIFLPRQVARGGEGDGEPASLGTLYACELAGAAAALVLIALIGSYRWTLVAYFAIAAVVMHLGVGRRWVTAAVGVAALAMALAYPALNRAAMRVFLRGYYGHVDPHIVATEYSAYQRIDVVDDQGARSLYLDGVPFYRSGDLDDFNVALAEVPGYLRGGHGRGEALVIGSGSFSSAARLHRLGYQVTVVELDRQVARAGFRWFQAVHRLNEGDVTLAIGDGRRFVERAAPGRFALIVLDVPAPYHLQTALLHTPRFYRTVRSRLAHGGMVALSLCGSLEDEVGGSIAASAASVFPDVMVASADSVGLDLLYAGERLPFSRFAVTDELGRRNIGGGAIGDREVRERLDAKGRQPLTERRMAAVLAMARSALPRQLGGDVE